MNGLDFSIVIAIFLARKSKRKTSNVRGGDNRGCDERDNVDQLVRIWNVGDEDEVGGFGNIVVLRPGIDVVHPFDTRKLEDE